jgi:RNA polymerase sigma-70 factor (ECF subfamily)
MAYGRARERFCKEVTRVGDAAFSRADDAVLDHDRAKSVSNLVARLPERQQEAVMLTFYRGMTQRQIAAHTGIPLGTIKTRIELALRKLRRALLISGHELHECLKAA